MITHCLNFFFGALPEDRVLVAAPLSGLEDSTRLFFFFFMFWEWALPGDRVLVAASPVRIGRFNQNFFESELFPGTESLLLPLPSLYWKIQYLRSFFFKIFVVFPTLGISN